MRLKHLKQEMLLPKKEYIINKMVTIQGLDVLILSFTIGKDKNCLWTISESEEFTNGDRYEGYDDSDEKFKTNREELIDNIETRRRNVYIKEIEIQGQGVKFGSSSSSHIYDMNKDGIMALQHFVEKGLISEEWDEVKLENLVITNYEQIEDEDTPIIDINKELDISLYINEDFIEIPIQGPFKLKFGKQDMETKIAYYDEELGEDKHFFINEIYSFDVYEDMKKKVEEIKDIEIRENTLNNFIEAIEMICPRDKNLAVIKYETPDNVQLLFNMKEFLDGEPKVYESGGAGIWASYGEGLGMNGHKLQECVLHPIDKDFDGEIELELFSRFLKIPGEVIKL